MLIRPATLEDVADITEIFNQSIRSSIASMHTQPRTNDQQLDWLQSRDERHPVLVAEGDGKTIGWAALGPWEDRLGYRHTAETSIYVDDRAAGHGVGTRLLQALVEESRKHNFHSLIARIADLGDSSADQASLRLHRKCGFELVGTMREAGHKFERWVDVHILELLLNGECETRVIAFWNGEIVPRSSISISIDDVGFQQGVIVSERLRTFAGKLHLLENHIERLFRGLDEIGLRLRVGKRKLMDAAVQIVQHNHALEKRGSDLGLSIFVTPGASVKGEVPSCQTTGMTTHRLAFWQWAHAYRTGQVLVSVKTQEVPLECVSKRIKHRSRMHYYLAENQAREKALGARALLLDVDGFVAEASTARIIAYRREEGLVSPHARKVLESISWNFTKALAKKIGVDVHERDLTLEDFYTADEVLWCSTPMCLLPVTEIDERTISDGIPGPLFNKLIDQWSRAVGIDIVDQARSFLNKLPPFPKGGRGGS